MKQNKTKKKIVSSLVAFVMIATMYGFLPMPNTLNAASMTNASDTLSDSDLSVAATHTIVATTLAVAAGDYVQAVFHDDFGDVNSANISCSGGAGGWTTSSPNTETARCNASGVNGPGEVTLVVTGLTNPSATGTVDVVIEHRLAGGDLVESVQVTVAIVDDITMTAHVDATLVFNIKGVAAAQVVNGTACTETTTATAVDFGTLAPDVAKVVCQELTVETNATEGYIVTVEQNDELRSAGGANINSFKDAADGSGLLVPEIWAVPTGTLDSDNEYGHMGFTSNDTDLAVDYTGNKFAGLNGTAATVVMDHDGPADGTTQDKGLARVAYKAEVTALQEAGDYTSTLTYIATPTY